jgi:hypothetical protein
MNVRINSVDLKDRTVADKLVAEAQEIYDLTAGREKRIIDAVLATLSAK